MRQSLEKGKAGAGEIHFEQLKTMRKAQIRCKNGVAETDINCLLCARDFPCIISYIPHNNLARHVI